jgi:hypothetical protein
MTTFAEGLRWPPAGEEKVCTRRPVATRGPGRGPLAEDANPRELEEDAKARMSIMDSPAGARRNVFPLSDLAMPVLSHLPGFVGAANACMVPV